MSREPEWFRSHPYHKAEGCQPSDTEKSVYGEGSWDAEARMRAYEAAAGEIHDLDDSIELIRSLTKGVAEKSARYVADTARFYREQAHTMRTIERISWERYQTAQASLHRHREEMAVLRRRIDRAIACLKYGREVSEVISILGGDE
jgi:hypothetical protein